MITQRNTTPAPPKLDAVAALRACARLTLQTDTLNVVEVAARALDVVDQFAGEERHALIAARQPVEFGGEVRLLAQRGLTGEDVAVVLALLSSRADTSELGAEEWALPDWIRIEQSVSTDAGMPAQRVVLLLRQSVPPTHVALPSVPADALAAVLEGASAALVAALRAEASRARLASAKQQEESLKAELLGTVSHELRSPLTAIRGYAASLLKHEQRLSRSERHEFLHAIEVASNRLDDVIERLLDMAQLAAGVVRMDRTPLDLVALAREALQAEGARARAAAADARLRLLAPTAPQPALPFVLGDARWLGEVFHHLMENAIKVTPDGGTVEVILRPAPPNVVALARQRGFFPVEASQPEGSGDMRIPPMVEIRVRDAGPGIPAEHLSRVFDRFHRVETELTRLGDGLGLGLAICKRIAELHNGAIWAESEPGQGSTFHVLLPALMATTVQ